MQVSACCLAYQFDFSKLLEIINARCHVVKPLNEEVIYCALSAWPSGADAFVFAPYGSIVVWWVAMHALCGRQLTWRCRNLPPAYAQKFGQILMPAATRALETADEDDFEYVYSASASQFTVVEFVHACAG